MAKSKDTRQNKKSRGRSRAKRVQHRSGFWLAIADVVSALLDRFGWPGLLVIVAGVFFEKYGTVEQKQELIDRYFLGKDVQAVYPIIVLGLLFAGIVLAQRAFYRRRLKIMRKELDRVTKRKTREQEERIGKPLHHTKITKKEE